MENNSEFGGIKKTGISIESPLSNNLKEEVENNGETYESYPGSPLFPKGVIEEFKDVKEDEVNSLINNDLYKDIEKLIIHWNNDGSKTAGRLIRRIIQIIIKDYG